MTTYLDYNATAPIRPEARDAMIAAMDATGNPSSVHQAGRHARKIMEQARTSVSKIVNAKPSEVVFTSGATEANNLAIQGFVSTGGGVSRVLVGATEHDSVLNAWADSEMVPVDENGLIDLVRLQRMLTDRDWRQCLICVMAVNNETGIVQPIHDVIEIARAAGAVVLCDAVQAAGKLDLSGIQADFISLSAHKFGGPRGIGALIVKNNKELHPLLRGGGQELGKRAGTENVPAIAGFGAVVEAVLKETEFLAQARQLLTELETNLIERSPQSRIIARQVPRVGTTTTIALPGVKAETQVMALDLDGVMVSAGSACSSGKVAASHVLTAMGLPLGVSDCAIRVSLGWESTSRDVAHFIDSYMKMVRRTTIVDVGMGQ